MKNTTITTEGEQAFEFCSASVWTKCLLTCVKLLPSNAQLAINGQANSDLVLENFQGQMMAFRSRNFVSVCICRLAEVSNPVIVKVSHSA